MRGRSKRTLSTPFNQLQHKLAASPIFAAVPALARRNAGMPDSGTSGSLLGSIGSLEVRLAGKHKQIKRAQRLRYQVFYGEMGAIADARTLRKRRDIDGFDRICDHLLVYDRNPKPGKLWGKPELVGTYRLLNGPVAAAHGGFYSQSEFAVADLVARHPQLNFLELGRSCVRADYRGKRTIELLWHGIWSYVRRHGCDVMIGCASFEGTDPDALAMPLSFLHHHAAAPDQWRVSALPHRHVDMNRVAKDRLDQKAALRALPPLIKGYLRLGAFVGEGAVIDHQFGTTDVLIIMPVAAINERYITHFGPGAERHAA